MSNWLKNNWFGLGIFIVSFSLRFFTYSSQPFANGWDAYFYIVQIKSYLEEGTMHSSRVSLFYPFLLFFYGFLKNYELTYQLASAVIVGMFSSQMYQTAKAINPNSDAKYLIGCFTVFSPQLTYVGAQFPKNLLGVVFLLVLTQFIFKKSLWKAATIAIINFFIHKMTAGLSVFLFLSSFTGQFIKKYVRHVFIAVLLLTFLLMLFPGILAIIELGRAGFGFGPPTWHSLHFIEALNSSMSTLWRYEIYAVNLVVLIVSISALIRRETSYHWYILLALLLILTFPLLEWSVLGLSFRLLVVFLILGVLTLNFYTFKLRRVILFISCLILAGGGYLTSQEYPTDQIEPPYGTYRLLTRKIQEIKQIDPELIIIHKAFAEYYTFRTGKDALPWIPEYEIEADKLWRIAYGVNSKMISYYADGQDVGNQLFELSPSYLMIREDLWAACTARMHEEDPDLFSELSSWKNPDSIRPDYLLDKKSKE